MLRLSEDISEADRKEVERRLKALEEWQSKNRFAIESKKGSRLKPERKKPTNIGFNHPLTYGVTFYPHVMVFDDDYEVTINRGHTYKERQEAIYRYVMRELGGQL